MRSSSKSSLSLCGSPVGLLSPSVQLAGGGRLCKCPVLDQVAVTTRNVELPCPSLIVLSHSFITDTAADVQPGAIMT